MATTYSHREWHYTGNSPNGHNIVHQNGRAQVLAACGITFPEPPDAPETDRAAWEAYGEAVNRYDAAVHRLCEADGGKEIVVRGRRILVKRHNSPHSHPSFGYEEWTDYELLD